MFIDSALSRRGLAGADDADLLAGHEEYPKLVG
jgi:hypothetical protein